MTKEENRQAIIDAAIKLRNARRFFDHNGQPYDSRRYQALLGLIEEYQSNLFFAVHELMGEEGAPSDEILEASNTRDPRPDPTQTLEEKLQEERNRGIQKNTAPLDNADASDEPGRPLSEVLNEVLDETEAPDLNLDEPPIEIPADSGRPSLDP